MNEPRVLLRDVRFGESARWHDDELWFSDWGAREVVRPIGHFAYVLECRWLVRPILTKVAGLPICDDPDGVDRALVHKQVASDIVAFFDKTLAKAD